MPAVNPAGGSVEASLLEVVHRLKEQIRERDRLLAAKTGDLVASRDYLRGVFAALTDAVLVIGDDGRILSANRAAAELIGQPEERLVGRPAAGLWAEPDQAALFEPDGLPLLLEQDTFQRTDMLLNTGSGPVPVLWSGSALRLAGETPAETRLVGVVRDMRVERKAEAERLRAMQALAASVAHEIRNPLGAIQNSVGLLLRDLPLEGDDRELLEIVGSETARINEIVAQFLEFARPAEAYPRLLQVDELAREVMTLAQQDPRAEGKQLALVVDPGLPEVNCDPTQIKQVLWNLVANGLDAARQRLALRIRPARASGVEVRVADDGPGMPPELLAEACEPFRTTKSKGSGLGLTVSRRIVAAHGGALRLVSVLERGTTASFTLPLRGPAGPELSLPSPAPAGPSGERQ